MKIFKRWFSVFLVAFLILILSVVPNLRTGLPEFQDTILRKIAHFVSYALLAIMFYKALKWDQSKVIIAIPVVFFLTMIFAISTESMQLFSQGRDPSINDLILDCLGIITGILIINNLEKFVISFNPKKAG